MFTPTQQIELAALILAFLAAALGLFVAWCAKWKRQWDAERLDSRRDRAEIKENSRRGANGNHVNYDQREDDPQGGV